MLVFVTALFLAPAGEEALIRGIAYPVLRRQWPPLASAFVTATLFAVLHGNLVQIVLTVPVGILLAYVYEASQRLWPGVLAHFLFNAAASFVPSRLVDGIAHPAMVAILGIAVVLLLFALAPGRYARRDHSLDGGARGHDPSTGYLVKMALVLTAVAIGLLAMITKHIMLFSTGWYVERAPVPRSTVLADLVLVLRADADGPRRRARGGLLGAAGMATGRPSARTCARARIRGSVRTRRASSHRGSATTARRTVRRCRSSPAG